MQTPLPGWDPHAYAWGWRQWKEVQLWHGKVLAIISDSSEAVSNGNGSNRHVGVGKRMSFALPVPTQQTRLGRNFRGDGEERGDQAHRVDGGGQTVGTRSDDDRIV